MALQLNQSAQIPVQAALKPLPRSPRKAHKHALAPPPDFNLVDDTDAAAPPSASSSSIISINQASSEKNLPCKAKPLKSDLSHVSMTRFLSVKSIQAYDQHGDFLGMYTSNRKTNMVIFLPCNSESCDDEDSDLPMASLTHYSVSQQSLKKQHRSLVDRGANGGIGGPDVRWIGSPSPPVHISVIGIGNHRINNIKVCTVSGVLSTQLCEVIGIFNHYTRVGDGHSIHSCI